MQIVQSKPSIVENLVASKLSTIEGLSTTEGLVYGDYCAILSTRWSTRPFFSSIINVALSQCLQECGFSPVWFCSWKECLNLLTKWFLNVALWHKVLSQCLQECGFSPVWFCSWKKCLNLFTKWFLNVAILHKVLSQCLQERGFSPVWHYSWKKLFNLLTKWFLNVTFLHKVLSQCLH